MTICAWQREFLCGEIVNGEMVVSDLGSITYAVWTGLSNHYRHVELDAFVIMPNHVHGLIVLSAEQTEEADFNQGRVKNPPLRKAKRHGLPEIIRGFKTYSSRRINEMRDNPGCPVWRRDYYDRIIRNHNELTRARHYIVNNPLQWECDREHQAKLT